VLNIKPIELAKAIKLIESRPLKKSGRQSTGADEGIINGQKKTTSEEGELDASNNQDEISSTIRGKISETCSVAGQKSLAVIKALDSPLRGSLFDYAEDRRDRNYFSARRRK
jgi:hypothetical protein